MSETRLQVESFPTIVNSHLTLDTPSFLIDSAKAIQAPLEVNPPTKEALLPQVFDPKTHEQALVDNLNDLVTRLCSEFIPKLHTDDLSRVQRLLSMSSGKSFDRLEGLLLPLFNAQKGLALAPEIHDQFWLAKQIKELRKSIYDHIDTQLGYQGILDLKNMDESLAREHALAIHAARTRRGIQKPINTFEINVLNRALRQVEDIQRKQEIVSI